jgi:subtilase family serine protease
MLRSSFRILARFRSCGAVAVIAGALALAQQSAGAAAELPGSMRPLTDAATGRYARAAMSVDVFLAPRNATELATLVNDRYDPASSGYRKWLAKGQFDALFAPSAAHVAAMTAYLRAHGLTVVPGASPYTVHAVGSSRTIESAFGTTLRTYRNRNGIAYYRNASPVQLPASLVSSVVAVVGLSNTVRIHSRAVLPLKHKNGGAPSCETPYVTRAQLYAAVNNGTSFPFGYGAGPGCSGLTPSQTNGIYGAPNVGPRGQGAGVTLGLFELSAYQQSDVQTFVHTFYGNGYRAPLVDINVDGGPNTNRCPSGDVCFPGYDGDIEVVADIENQLAIAPAVRNVLVYNAPNDETGQTSLDEYAKIASDDAADSISSSWGVCEDDIDPSYAQAENVIFQKIALQGQSLFNALGDSGAFGCIYQDANGNLQETEVNAGDPGAQPWVTGVGGTSLESYNPGTSPYASYPNGVETVWNVDNLCNTSSNEGGFPGLDWCVFTGGGNGAGSEYWGRPSYQNVPGITSRYTTYANGSTQCTLARIGTPCRELPDVSANADQYTPYAEYCTGNANTPGSSCAADPGWFGIGGTSLSSPLWSAIVADRDSYQGYRTGNINPLVYALYAKNPSGYFNDITGYRQSTNDNGFFPTTFGYDEATGIGTPKMAALITGNPQY